MFRTRTRTILTFAVVLEGAIAAWALGAGGFGLLAMVAAATVADTAWGIARRGAIADFAGLEVALALAVMIAVGAPGTMTALTAAACAAWVIRDGRSAPATPARAQEVAHPRQ